MDIKLASKLQQKVIMTHRLVFILFVLQRITIQVVYRNLPTKNTIRLCAFVAVCAVLEELLAVINVEQDNRLLTPEILTAAGWKKIFDTGFCKSE